MVKRRKTKKGKGADTNFGILKVYLKWYQVVLTLEQPYANKSESSEIAKSASLVSRRLVI